MAKRILALGAMLVVILSPALLLGALYQRERSVPYKSFYAPVCEPWINPPCASIDGIFVAGTALRVAGVVLCLLAVVLGALLLLRLTRRWWLALVSAIVATASGASALWLSQRALGDYRTVSLLPERFPPGFFERYLAYVQGLARTYVVWGVASIMLTTILLIVSMALLWGATGQREANAPARPAAGSLVVIRLLASSAFLAVLLVPALALGAVYELERSAPCQQRFDPACNSLDAMIVAGAVTRGAGIVLFGLAILLGCMLLRRPRPRLPFALGAATLACASGAWLLWLSQRALEDYLPAPENYPSIEESWRITLIGQLAQSYVIWSIGAVIFTAGVLLACALLLRNPANPRPPTPSLVPAL